VDGAAVRSDALAVAAPYTIDPAIQRFLDHLRVERGLSPNTLAAYGTDLARFSRELVRRRGKRVRLKDVAEADILAHLEHLMEAGMTIASQAGT
jgi:integrase/recombinase XerD